MQKFKIEILAEDSQNRKILKIYDQIFQQLKYLLLDKIDLKVEKIE